MDCTFCKKEILSDADMYGIETPNLIFECHLDCAIELEFKMEDLVDRRKRK